MRHLCALLAREILRWPDVVARPMFGMRAFYRGSVIFAMLPGKRAMETPRSIAYKLLHKWRAFELQDGRDIDSALARLDRAYARAI
jgi:hypothetical protein